VKDCKQCVVFAIGSPTLPEKVHCDEFSSGNKSSAGVIAGSVIAVLLVLGGVAGFCV
ncbi:Molecular chaperone, DnaJ family protein, partial [Giardia duodenalis]